MAAQLGDLWSKIIEEEQEHQNEQLSVESPELEIAVVYQRPKQVHPRRQSNMSTSNESWKSLAPVKRVSWDRALSTRGRISVAANQPPLPRRKERSLHCNIENQMAPRKSKKNAESHNLQKKDLQPPKFDLSEDIEAAISKLSLVSTAQLPEDCRPKPFSALLTLCGQTSPSKLETMFPFCDQETIVKVGEGTYGEAFKVGNFVLKIVPFGGDFLVNGEQQKESQELLDEAVLSFTLNELRENAGQLSNACNTFVRTVDLKVCQGRYDPALISAWENWDKKHHSENDHPKEFPGNQCYVVFGLQHGGQDLEKFVLLNFDEARSLLVQVTLALAVAEAAYEFEHRDLHWGNILLSRKESASLTFILEEKPVVIKTFGLHISIIDFTLSRINTGEDILFLDLSSDPELFNGPKGDIQANTYRKMRLATQEDWEGSFPKTNVLWMQYLVDILLSKKSYEQTTKQKKEFRSFKKRLNGYGSAKETFMKDSFFHDLLIHEC